MLRFHFCKKFIEQVKGQTFEKSIYTKISENKKRKRKDLKRLGNFACFRGSVYILKAFRPNTRTIIEETNLKIDKEEVKVFFVRELISGQTFDYVYSKTIYPQLISGEWIKNNPLPEEDKEKFISKYNNKVKSPDKKAPSSKLTSWLKDFKFDLKNEIFETEDWVRYALNNSLVEGMIDKYVNTFRIVLNEILENKNKDKEELIKEGNGIKINKYTNQNVGILYSKIQISDKDIVFILYNAAHIETQAEHWKKVIQNIKDVTIEFENNIESIRRKAFRAYPKWTISKDDLWFNIQKSTELNNLSLTKEQIDFFEGFKFPYYINGQAGSGKSTMLYYLFANAYFYKHCGEINGEILFLTESEALLEHSKNSVYDLLINNPQFELKNEEASKSKASFHSFKNFLLSLLPDEDRHNFKKDKYLNFSTFKYLYENSNFAKHHIKNYSAEESWFTITTYIYGYDSEQKITSKDYLDFVPKKSRTIPKDKFEGIEKVVLPFYEKLLNEGYWDKLKIIKYIDENISLKAKYNVLICDEAQDFSKVELRFILRLSEYLEYDLSQTAQVPIVFAGDPNQTVNPTGFREEEMTSMLHKELQQIAKFDYDAHQNLYNPIFNYRSTQSVVSLANFVQYHRMKNLGIKQVKPQEAKRPSLNSNFESNIFLNYKSIDQNKVLQKSLIEKLKYKIFIVPVDAQEKENYIKEHNLLSLIDEVEIKTSVEAKGAEYEQVVLFGFGDYFIKKFKNLSENKVSTNEQFRRGYFFNKLYVGLTRAQTELILIDSEASQNDFWEKLVDHVDISNQKWEKLANFKDKTILYNPDSVNNILQSNPQDAEKNAQEDKNQGIYDQNPARLKVAVNQFFKLGKEKEAIECQALTEEIKQNWNRAADFHLKNSDYEKAAICLFEGRHFKELVSKIGNNLKNKEQDMRLIISRLMNGERIMKQDIDVLNKNKEILAEPLKELAWRDDLINQFIISSKSIQVVKQKKDFVQILEFIANSNEENLWKEIANIRFELKHYQKAIDAWNIIELFENNPKYYVAQIELAQNRTNFESVIVWKNKLSKNKNPYEKTVIFREIIKIYEDKKHAIKAENPDFYLAVYRAFIFQNPEGNLAHIGKETEKKLSQNLTKLVSFYFKIINDGSLENSVKNFVIERWAKTIWKNNKSNTDNSWLKKLNDDYLQMTDNQELIYKAFDLEELENISEYPQEIQWKPSPQFKKITIKNFRRFEKLEVKHIGQFNLILGDNNVGKTSLLEGLLFSHQKSEYFQNLVFAFIERENTIRIQIDGKERYQINDYKSIRKDFTRRGTQEFEFDLYDKRQSWNFKIRAASLEEIRVAFPTTSPIDVDEYICLLSDTGEVEIIELALLIKKLMPSDSINSPLIPFGKGFGRDLASTYYEKIDKIKSKRNSFILSMKTFIPNIDRISVNPENGEIDIEESTSDNSAPLHQYGEGANKLFRILVQLSLQENKVLLIDEIDAGIHYSRFEGFWKVILQAAEQNKVQIFATTHNIECVTYFKEILQEEDFSTYQDKSRIITLRKLPDKSIKAYTRFFNGFEYELDNEFEIRGGKL